MAVENDEQELYVEMIARVLDNTDLGLSLCGDDNLSEEAFVPYGFQRGPIIPGLIIDFPTSTIAEGALFRTKDERLIRMVKPDGWSFRIFRKIHKTTTRQDKLGLVREAMMALSQHMHLASSGMESDRQFNYYVPPITK